MTTTEERLIQPIVREDIRMSIIDAAAELFFEKGYSATTIDDILKRVGCSKGAFYHYFKAKQDVLYLIHDAAMEHALKSAEDVLARTDLRPEEQLAEHISSMVEAIWRFHPYIAVFINARRELSPDKFALVKIKRDRGRRVLEEIIQRGIDGGALRADLDPKLVALAILGMGNWMHNWYRRDGRLSWDEIARTFRSLVLDGIRVSGDALATRRSNKRGLGTSSKAAEEEVEPTLHRL